MFLVALTNFVFVSSMLLWMVFLWNGSSPMNLVRVVDNNDPSTLVLWDCCLSLTFFLQHSLMVRQPFRRFLANHVVTTKYHGVIYTCTSGVVLSMVVVMWQKSNDMVLSPSSLLVRGLFRAVFVLALVGLRWAAQSLESFDVCGLDPLDRKIGKTKEKPPQSPARATITTSGPYRYVRHPFYFGCLVLFWSCPNLSWDRLLYNVLWSLWVVIGTILEERDLVREFGKPYRDYQRQVPMLIPWLVFRSEQTQGNDPEKNKSA